MKISNIVLSAMVSSSSLVSFESNAQISKRPSIEIQKRQLDSVRKVDAEQKKILAQKRKNDSTIRVHKYCPGCGKG